MNKLIKRGGEINKLVFVNISVLFLIAVLVENIRRGMISTIMSFDAIVIVVMISGIIWLISAKRK